MSAELPPLREVIERYGLGAKKSLGQHFLLDLIHRLLLSACRAECGTQSGNRAWANRPRIDPTERELGGCRRLCAIDSSNTDRWKYNEFIDYLGRLHRESDEDFDRLLEAIKARNPSNVFEDDFTMLKVAFT